MCLRPGCQASPRSRRIAGRFPRFSCSGARVVVFRTPAAFGPAGASRRAAYRCFESIGPEAVKAIELRGPWETHIVEPIWEDLGVIHAVRPFDKEAATYGVAYRRLHGS